MIGYVKGTLEESRPGKVVIDVNGFGVNVCVSDTLREELPAIGNFVKLYTYMSVREDAMTLYGFLTRDALDLFNLLITVSSIGPKVALGLLGAYSVADIKYLIVTEDVSKLSKAPSIGRKTAERIVLELKDKVNKDEINGLLDAVNVNASGTALTDNCKDAIEALVALGYDRKDATNAVSMVEHPEELDAGQILKLSLKNMF